VGKHRSARVLVLFHRRSHFNRLKRQLTILAITSADTALSVSDVCVCAVQHTFIYKSVFGAWAESKQISFSGWVRMRECARVSEFILSLGDARLVAYFATLLPRVRAAVTRICVLNTLSKWTASDCLIILLYTNKTLWRCGGCCLGVPTWHETPDTLHDASTSFANIERAYATTPC
jgi:hypothetical protein